MGCRSHFSTELQPTCHRATGHLQPQVAPGGKAQATTSLKESLLGPKILDFSQCSVELEEEIHPHKNHSMERSSLRHCLAGSPSSQLHAPSSPTHSKLDTCRAGEQTLQPSHRLQTQNPRSSPTNSCPPACQAPAGLSLGPTPSQWARNPHDEIHEGQPPEARQSGRDRKQNGKSQEYVYL